MIRSASAFVFVASVKIPQMKSLGAAGASSEAAVGENTKGVDCGKSQPTCLSLKFIFHSCSHCWCPPAETSCHQFIEHKPHG